MEGGQAVPGPKNMSGSFVKTKWMPVIVLLQRTRIIKRMRCVSTKTANCPGSEVVISLSVLTSLWQAGAVSWPEWSQRS